MAGTAVPRECLLHATQAIVGKTALDRAALCRIFCSVLTGRNDRGKLVLRRRLSGRRLPLPKLGGSAGRRDRIPCSTGDEKKQNKKRDPPHPTPRKCSVKLSLPDLN